MGTPIYVAIWRHSELNMACVYLQRDIYAAGMTSWTLVDSQQSTLMADDLWPLLLTWFNFNPSMDK